MKNKIYLIILLALGFWTISSVYAQKKDKYGYPIYKELSEADLQRMFGGEYPARYFKTTGDPRIIKESIISGNNITTIVFNFLW